MSMATCPDCGANLDDVPQGEPCPDCGGMQRSIAASAHIAAVSVMAAEPDLDLQHGDHPPWTEKWHSATHCLDQLRSAYSAWPVTIDELEQRVTTFFVECDHLRDWLKKDLTALNGLTEPDLANHFSSTESLRRCNAICNTHKHHTRDSGTTARIRGTHLSRSGSFVTIEIDWALPSATTEDALELADACLSSWRNFLENAGISVP